MLAIALDMLKAAVPVAVGVLRLRRDRLGPDAGRAGAHPGARLLALPGLPWGKALACTFGVWSALTVPFGPFVMGGSVFLFHKVFTVSAWAVMGAMLMLLVFLLIAGAALPLLAAWAGTVALLAWTHRRILRQPPALRPRARAWFGR